MVAFLGLALESRTKGHPNAWTSQRCRFAGFLKSPQSFEWPLALALSWRLLITMKSGSGLLNSGELALTIRRIHSQSNTSERDILMYKRKPRIFIASSKEALATAEAINVNLDFNAETVLWTRATPSSNFIDVLLDHAGSVDYAAFVCSPDDMAIICGEEKRVIRDNVLFELGIFMGRLGKERCFVITPRGDKFHVPSDLLGFTPLNYDSSRTDGDLISATRAAGTLMSEVMNRMGQATASDTVKEVKSNDFRLLMSFPNANEKIFRNDLKKIFLKFNKPVDRDSALYIGNYYVQRNVFAQWNTAGWIEFSENDTKLIWHISKIWLAQDEYCVSDIPDYPVFEIHIGRGPDEWRLRDIDGDFLPHTKIPVLLEDDQHGTTPQTNRN